jgi:hypothetical protein
MDRFFDEYLLPLMGCCAAIMLTVSVLAALTVYVYFFYKLIFG